MVDEQGKPMYAIKVAVGPKASMSVRGEFQVLSALNQRGCKGIPFAHKLYDNTDSVVMLMDLLGPDLEVLKRFSGGRIESKTVVMVGYMLVKALQGIHRCGYVHRDLKPANIVMGMGTGCNVPHLVDFGTAYMRGFMDERVFVGTPRFASRAAHDMLPATPIDDLESLIYIFVYLINGELPWQGLPIESASTRHVISEIKHSLDICKFCRGMPPAIQRFAWHVFNHPRDTVIDYGQLLSFFEIDIRGVPVSERIFIWQRPESKEAQSSKVTGVQRNAIVAMI